MRRSVEGNGAVLRRAAAALLLAILIGGCSRPRPLRVGMAIPSAVHNVLWIAQEGGFFRRQGLAVEVYTLKGSADAVRLLVSGDMDIVLAGGDAVVKADLAGADVAAFAGLVNTFYHRLASVPGVRTPADLKGRAIGLPFLGGPQDMTVRAVLRRSKLAYGTDVRIRSMGAEYARLAAVTQGRVDAVTTDAPPSVLKALGLHVVADAPSWGLPFPYLAAAARRTFLRGKQDKAMRFLKALCGAMEFYRDHRDESLAMLAKHAANERGSTVDAEEAYLHNGPARYTYPPAVDPGTYAAVLDLISDERAAGRRPEDFIDSGFMEKLTRDGFFSR